LQQIQTRKLGRPIRIPPITAKFFNPHPPDLDPSDVILLAQEFRTCLKCGEDLIVSNDDKHEWVCKNCGHVWGSEQADVQIPFEDSSSETGHSEGQYSPEGHMDLGKNLGGQVTRNLNADIIEDPFEDMPEELRMQLKEKLFLEELLGHSIKNNSHDPFTWSRSNQLRVPLTHPLIQKFLMEARRLCNKYDLHKRGNVDHICFGDQLAIQLRRIADFYINGGNELHFDPALITMGLFCLRFKQTYPSKYESYRSQKDAKEQNPELFLSPNFMRYCEGLYKNCRPIELPTLTENDVQVPYTET
jgi:hypothetical protein